LDGFLAKLSNPACRSAVEALWCGFACSPVQSAYLDIFSPEIGDVTGDDVVLTETDDVIAASTYRVCSSTLDEVFATCKASNYDGSPVVLSFETPADLLVASAYPGVNVSIVDGSTSDRLADFLTRPFLADPDNSVCFGGFEGDRRTLSVVYGTGMGGGLTYENSTILLNAHDDFGNAVSFGGEPLNLHLSGPSRITPTVVDHANGTYTLTYNPPVGGLYTLDGDLAQHTPYKLPELLSVTAASVCPVQDRRSARPADGALASCAAFEDNSCCDGADNNMIGRLHEDYAESYASVPECLALFERVSCGVYCSPEQSHFFEPLRNLTGFSVCEPFCHTWFDACADVVLPGGMGTVRAMYEDNPILFCLGSTPAEYNGRPFDVIVRSTDCYDGEEPDVSCRDSYAFGDGIYDFTTGTEVAPAVAGRVNNFTIQAVDLYQNKKRTGGDSFAISFPADAEVVNFTLTDNEDGTYTVSYLVLRTGCYDVGVTCDESDEQIEHSPFTLCIGPGELYNATIICPEEPLYEPGDVAYYTVYAHDRWNNTIPTAAGHSFNSYVLGPNAPGGGFDAPLADNCNGLYKGYWEVASEYGEYFLHVENATSGYDVIDSPCRIIVGVDEEPVPCRNTSFVSGPGTVEYTPGQANNFTVHIRDSNNLVYSDCSDIDLSLAFTVYKEELTTPLVDVTNDVNVDVLNCNGDGTWTVIYTPTNVSETFNITVNLLTLDPETGLTSPACFGVVDVVTVIGPCDCECGIGRFDMATGETYCQCYSPCRVCPVPEDFLEDPDCLPYCCPPPPEVEKVWFNVDPSTSLLVRWYYPVDQFEYPHEFPCDRVLNTSRMVGHLGDGAFCSWRDDRTLIAWLGSNATISYIDNSVVGGDDECTENRTDVGDEIWLNRDTVQSIGDGEYSNEFQENRCVLYAGDYEGDPPAEVLYAPILLPPTPRIVVSLPELFNPCFPFILDATSIYGVGGRDPTTFNVTLANADTTPHGPELNAALAARAGQLRIEFPVGSPEHAFLEPGNVYVFHFLAINHFDVSSELEVTTIVDLPSGAASPQIIVRPSQVYLGAGDKGVKLHTSVQIPSAECAPSVPEDPDVVFRWRQVSGPDVGDIPLLTSSTLSVPEGSMRGGEEYAFRVDVYYRDRPSLRGSFTVPVSVAVDAPLVARIDGGSRAFFLGSTDPLVFNGTRSRDRGMREDEFPLSYYWTIESTTRVDSLGRPLHLKPPQDLNAGAGPQGPPIITIPTSSLSSDTVDVWLVKLNVSQDLTPAGGEVRHSIDEVYLTLREGVGPLVTISAPDASGGSYFSPSRETESYAEYAPNARVALLGEVNGLPLTANVSYLWSTVGGTFALDERNDDVILTPLPPTTINLVLGPYATGPGSRLKFRLSATDEGSDISGFAEMNIVAYARPNAGYCVLSPGEGVPLTTTFTVTCRYFDDESSEMPLRYRLWWHDTKDGDNHDDDLPLNVEASFANINTFVLPPGEAEIIVEIIDQELARSTYHEKMPVSVSGDVDLAVLAKFIDDAIQNNNPDDMLNAFGILAVYLESLEMEDRKRVTHHVTRALAKRQAIPPGCDEYYPAEARKRQVEGTPEECLPGGPGITSTTAAPATTTIALPPVTSEPGMPPEEEQNVDDYIEIITSFPVPANPAATESIIGLLVAVLELGGGATVSDVGIATIIRYLNDVASPIFCEQGISSNGDRTTRMSISMVAAVMNTRAGRPETRVSEDLAKSLRLLLTCTARANLLEMAATEETRTTATSDNSVLLSIFKDRTLDPLDSSLALDFLAPSGVQFDLSKRMYRAIRENADLREVGVVSTLIRPWLYELARVPRDSPIYAASRIAGLDMYDPDNNPFAVDDTDALGGDPINITMMLQESPQVLFNLADTEGACYFLEESEYEYSEEGCTSLGHREGSEGAPGAVQCACTHLTDFAGTVRPRTGPPLPPGGGLRPGLIRSGAVQPFSVPWALLLIMLFLWLLMCCIGLMILYHSRRGEPEDAEDALAPYMDRAAGAGMMAALAAPVGDVSASSEMERRDYALPVGMYQVPEATESDDLNRSDFSLALSGEEEALVDGAGAGYAGASGSHSELGLDSNSRPTNSDASYDYSYSGSYTGSYTGDGSYSYSYSEDSR
jgi:hypothetical protein